MFDTEQLKAIDSSYFIIIIVDDYDITIQSRNTGHYWYLHSTDAPVDAACVIFHKHKYSHPYHQHGRARTLRQAVRSIRGHDLYQMNGRRPVKR